MKIKITSTDRIGISQEILSKFASKEWNVKSIEVQSKCTFVHLDYRYLTLDSVADLIMPIAGVESCGEIDQMPTEQREKHVQALLAKITDPIIDIDDLGNILACNHAALSVLNLNVNNLANISISDFIDVEITDLLQDAEFSMSLTLANKRFIADVNPVISAKKITGAVIYLKSVEKVGRQLSLVQTPNDNAISSILGSSEKVQLVRAQIKRFSELELPVLIVGNTGTGKELAAQALHQLSDRKGCPFLTINCAAIPEQLLESELFGYESGAFTGAKRGGKPGLFELANGGTLFLDEIAEMSSYLQAKLLRFLQDFTYRKVGGTKELKADVKIISASHQNFTKLIEHKNFREDLYYRLNVLKLELPTLAQRKEDIDELVSHFIVQASEQVNQRVPDVLPQALEQLEMYHWPGNIRQLENVIFKLIAISDGQHIRSSHVQKVLYGDLENNTEKKLEGRITDWANAQADFEKNLLEQLYPLYPTTRKLAERLNVSHNKIAMKLRAYNIK